VFSTWMCTKKGAEEDPPAPSTKKCRDDQDIRIVLNLFNLVHNIILIMMLS
jgi:hypothetical protein